MRQRLISLPCWVILHIMVASCSDKSYPQSPDEVLEKYLQRDSDGSRLDTMRRKMFELYTTEPVTVETRPSANVIASYKVMSLAVNGDEATARVKFGYIGDIREMYYFTSRESKFIPTIYLTKKFGQWKVKPYSPHVHWEAVVTYLESDIKNSPDADPGWKRHIENTIQEIKSAANSYLQLPDLSKFTSNEIAQQYVELNAQGAMLTKEGRAKLNRLSKWGTNEQTTRVTHILDNYKITRSKVDGNRAVVTAEFINIGYIEDYTVFIPRRKTFVIDIELERKDGVWEIQTRLVPNVFWQSMNRYLEEEQKDSKTPFNSMLINEIRKAAK